MGAIAAGDREKTIVVKRGGAPITIRYADLRRFTRNSDGSLSILYSSIPDPDDPNRVLLRLQDVTAPQIMPGNPRDPLQFVLELPDGTTETIQLLDLRDFINVVF